MTRLLSILSILLLLALCACKTVPREFGELPTQESLPPIPSFAKAMTAAVVLPPEPVSLVFSWETKETGRVDYYAYYGWSEDGITNLFGVTDNWAITNSVIWPDWADYIYGNVVAQNFAGRSDPSYTERMPAFPPNAVELSATPEINGQVLVCESPDGAHWVCYYTTLPVTNAITDADTFYRVIPSIGFPTNSSGDLLMTGLTPIKLSLSPRREWNAEKKHYGQ